MWWPALWLSRCTTIIAGLNYNHNSVITYILSWLWLRWPSRGKLDYRRTPRSLSFFLFLGIWGKKRWLEWGYLSVLLHQMFCSPLFNFFSFHIRMKPEQFSLENVPEKTVTKIYWPNVNRQGCSQFGEKYVGWASHSIKEVVVVVVVRERDGTFNFAPNYWLNNQEFQPGF